MNKKIKRIKEISQTGLKIIWIFTTNLSSALIRYLYINQSSFKYKFPLLSGNVAVFGSAPSAGIPKGWNDDWMLVSANSSQYISNSLGLRDVDITISAISPFVPQNEYITKYMDGSLQALRGLKTKTLIVFEEKYFGGNSNARKKQVRRCLEDLDYKYEEIMFMSWGYRHKLVVEILGDDYFKDNVLSTGLFCAITAYKYGAKNIVLTGFSLSHHKHGYPDHFFNGPGGRGEKGRGELAADLRAIEIIIAKKFPIYAADLEFSRESGLVHWHNKLEQTC